jgi:hypothetical protein
MKPLQFDDLRSIRQTLGKSQSQLAALLGISVRAVQSYEQGWRPVPDYVQKCIGLLLFLTWSKKGKKTKPCWVTRRCSDDDRAVCPVYELQAGHLCWMIGGTYCQGQKQKSWAAKLAKCRKCPVITPWLGKA